MTDATELRVSINIGQESTSTFEVTDVLPMLATSDPRDDWSRYLEYEARRRGVTTPTLQRESDAASKALSALVINFEKLRAMARTAPLDHPYLLEDDETSPF